MTSVESSLGQFCQVRRKTKPRTVDLYEVFCAVLYLPRTGCPWRALPSDFPKWRTVHSYFAKWSEPSQDGVSLLEQALKNQVGAARERQGRNASSTRVVRQFEISAAGCRFL